MSAGYTPGLKVSARTRHQVRRRLPLAGDVLVEEGQQVQARQVVAQTFMPGDITPLNLAKLLSLPPADVPECMLKKEGDQIAVGDALARTKGIFGRFRNEHASQVTGTIESISAVTGQVIVRGTPLPVEVAAYLAGRVVEVIPNEGCVIEAEVTFVQGIFGIGGEAFGPIHMACRQHDQELVADLITPAMKGAVVIGGARVTEEAIERAVATGVAALVTGGVDDQDLETFLGYSLGVAITGSERVGVTLIITEGFGEISMAERTFALLASREGADAAVNGATQIRAGVMRPEIMIPLLEADAAEGQPSDALEGSLTTGSLVRVIRDPYFGLIGTVTAIPPELQVLASGSRARVIEVTFSTGDGIMIPRANVERIES